ncbi:MAG: hypothetical protein LC624_06975 [Halobacteriales archaeon]|nr:hypothetical protein [Halobacteriales archaeon]
MLLIEAASTARPGEPIPDAFAPRQAGGKAYTGTVLNELDAVATSGILNSNGAQLLDATVNYQMAHGKRRGGAVGPAEADGDIHPPFLSHDQGHVLRAFNVVWIIRGHGTHDPVQSMVSQPAFDRVAKKLRDGLAARPAPTGVLHSRDAEKLVLPVFDDILREEGFERAAHAAHSYQGFWRRPTVDGLWTRDTSTLRKLVLEVKLGEDQHAPLSQLAEGIGHFDAAVQVRLVPHAPAPHESEVHLRMERAKAAFEAAAPVRYLTWVP